MKKLYIQEEATFENSSHIVFAYQLKKIRCGKDKRIKSRDYREVPCSAPCRGTRKGW